ncbi:hypothetical protein F5Y11DRAFT_363859 [Daldinia sp. FL1419]|nr:hypothetical protein F5Y11DRAFT_363859 [Daldinia sp. FL1419]
MDEEELLEVALEYGDDPITNEILKTLRTHTNSLEQYLERTLELGRKDLFLYFVRSGDGEISRFGLESAARIVVEHGDRLLLDEILSLEAIANDGHLINSAQKHSPSLVEPLLAQFLENLPRRS